jgi:hypothetical protein
MVLQHTTISKQESGHFINLSSAAGVSIIPEEQFTAVPIAVLVLSLKGHEVGGNIDYVNCTWCG